MKPRIIFTIILLLSLFWLNLAALPKAYTAAGNPALYQSLKAKATNNILKLESKTRQGYQHLLKRYDDVLMSYLVAYEPDSNLQLALPEWVESNYLQIKKLLQDDNPAYDPEFFLSYVACQSVADERIQPYRKALLEDGLAELKKSSKDKLELYREVCKWCLERLVFQPTSGRDQSPLDIAQKSWLGRCEEMQILFVAAARTVGLPARPASTPWWAHTDNNHAWAEVWLEDAWHYTGDMDAAYYPDQTWFSGMIDKTVLILASGSLPSDSDEILSTGTYSCTINSTRNYAKERSRRLSIHVLDEAGNPIADAALGFMVYNWGALRPLTYVQTDQDGFFRITVGRGAFYLSAIKDDKSALACVPSSEEESISLTLVLSKQPLAEQDMILVYPSNPFEWKQAPQSWDEDVALIKKRIAKRDAFYKARAVADTDSLYWDLVSKCRGNSLEFQLFASRFQPVNPRFMQFLLENDPKLLWQMNASQFEAMYRFFQIHADADLPDEALYSLISPSVYFEELPQPFPGKKGSWHLYPRDFSHKGKSELEKLQNATRWLNKRYKTSSKKSLSGILPLSLAWKQKYLSPVQKRMLMVSLARANGIAADFSRLPNLVVVLLNDEFSYWDISKGEIWKGDAQEAAEDFELMVSVLDENELPLALDPSQLMLTRWEDGMFYSLNYRFAAQEKGIYTATAPAGSYYLQFGYRISNDQTGFIMRKIDSSEKQEHAITLKPSLYPHSWADIDEATKALIPASDLQAQDLILLGSLDQENSVRIAEKLQNLEKRFLWLGYSQSEDPPANYRYLPSWHQLVIADQRHTQRTITLRKTDSGWQMYEGMWDRLPE